MDKTSQFSNALFLIGLLMILIVSASLPAQASMEAVPMSSSTSDEIASLSITVASKDMAADESTAAGVEVDSAPTPATVQDQMDDEKIWKSFTDWILTLPKPATLAAFGEALAKEGVPENEVKRRLDVIRKLYKDHPEKAIEVTYDNIFSKPVTGDIKTDGFNINPSEFMMESLKGLEPGTALDVGAGQGRNSVWMARQGWDVTGIDISSGGLKAAEANAEKAGVTIKTVKTTYEDFDFGNGKWDLIVMILSWAPVEDADFVARLEAALKPGGVLVFEHVLLTEKQKFPDYVHGLKTNELLGYFKNFNIKKYEEGVWVGDWGGPPGDLVRMIVRKK